MLDYNFNPILFQNFENVLVGGDGGCWKKLDNYQSSSLIILYSRVILKFNVATGTISIRKAFVYISIGELFQLVQQNGFGVCSIVRGSFGWKQLHSFKISRVLEIIEFKQSTQLGKRLRWNFTFTFGILWSNCRNKQKFSKETEVIEKENLREQIRQG